MMRFAGLPTVTRMSPELVTDWAIPGLRWPWKRRLPFLSRTVRYVPSSLAVRVSAALRIGGLADEGSFVGRTVGCGVDFGVGVVTVAVVVAVLGAFAPMSLGRGKSRTLPPAPRPTRNPPTPTTPP